MGGVNCTLDMKDFIMSNAAYATAAVSENVRNAGIFPVAPFSFRRFWIHFGSGAHVKKVSGLNSLYQLGFITSQLKAKIFEPQTRVIDILPICAMLHAQLADMSKGSPVPFDGTGKVMKEFLDTIDDLKRQITGDEILNVKISEIVFDYRLNDVLTRLESILGQELDAMPIWFVTKRRAYSIDALIDNAETIFDAKTILLLSARTILDVRQAGRAIAFEVPTAAGFHAVRATEAVARGYHEIIIGARPGEDTPLGPLVNALRKTRDGLLASRAIDKEDLLNIVIDMLSRINNVYRKPIAHPDMVLDLQGAMNVFDSAKCAIDLMLEDAEHKHSSPPIAPGFF